MMIALANEEDDKIKIIVPFLQSLGFDISELFYEQSFTLHIGRFTHRVDTEKQVRSVQPRLDILVTRNGQNLFVVEVKGPDIAIDSDDIDQAVSYARLVHPIAPYCLITNGQVWKLVDTITKEVPQNTADLHLNLSVTLPEEAYYQAIKFFLGYSRENILSFCQWQVKDYMDQLRGSGVDRDKKYIPELYEECRDLANNTQKFLASEEQCFVTIGDSGRGKTCWACDTALHYLKQGYAILFYRGSDVVGGILKAISRDLNWALSPQHDEIQTIKRLLELFRNEKILVWIDDIDGISPSTAIRILTEFLRRIGIYPIKLFLTCKSETWKSLLEEDGTPTLLSSRVFRVAEEKGYKIGSLDDQEFYSMIEKYRSFYNYRGPFDSETLEACKQSPFLMRVLFEVATALSLSHLGYSVANFYEAYFQKLCDRFEQKDMIQRLLPAIARCFYDQNKDELELHDLLQTLGFSLLDSLPQRLFELNILERSYREQTTYVGFYFKKLRDFLIAFRALKWQNLSPQDLQCEIEKREVSGIRLDALNLYYSLAVDEHKRALDDLLYDNAHKYVQLYQEILDNDFSSFKSAFPPYTTGPIGFVGYLDLSRRVITYHGFRPIKETDKTVFFFPKSIERDNGYLAYRTYLYGPLKWRGSSFDFRAFDISKAVIWEELRPSLEGIIEHGRLDESQNRDLLIERVLVTCLRHYKGFFQLQQKDPTASYLPLDLKKLKEFVLYKIAYHVLMSRRLDRNEGPGKVEEKWNGSIRSRSISFTVKEQTELEEQAWAIARNGEDLSKETHFNRSSDYGKFLLQDIESLAKLGVTTIVSSPLTGWYNKYSSGLPMPLQWDTNSLVSLRQFVENLYLSFLQEYRTLVERNFPTLCQYFDLYRRMPLNLMVAVECENEPLPLINYPDVTVLVYTDKSQPQNSVLLSSIQEIERRKDEIWSDPKYYQASVASSSLFLYTESYMPFEVDKQRCVLRNLVYETIKEDLKPAFLMFAAKHGVEVNKPYQLS